LLIRKQERRPSFRAPPICILFHDDSGGITAGPGAYFLNRGLYIIRLLRIWCFTIFWIPRLENFCRKAYFEENVSVLSICGSLRAHVYLVLNFASSRSGLLQICCESWDLLCTHYQRMLSLHVLEEMELADGHFPSCAKSIHQKQFVEMDPMILTLGAWMDGAQLYVLHRARKTQQIAT
jgi:hypothetical protein